MLDNFLNKINSIAKNGYVKKSFNDNIAQYNKEVLERKKIQEIEEENKRIENIRLSQLMHAPGKHHNFYNSGSGAQRSGNTNYNNKSSSGSGRSYYNKTQNYNKKPQQNYMDDGSFYCSYATGGNTLVCYKDKEKIEFLLDKINHPNAYDHSAKKANYFLNDLVKKKKVYLLENKNGFFEAYLDLTKEKSINQMMIDEGFDNSEVKNIESESKENIIKKNSADDKEFSKKKNYAYGLFATNHDTFEALYNKNKITLKLSGIDLDYISKEDKNECKAMIYEFVSKKSIILNFIKEEKDIHFVEVSNKDGEILNNLILNKKFKNNVDNNTTDSFEEEDFSGDNDNMPEVTNLAPMFKKPLVSNPDSPFAKSRAKNQKTTQESIVNNENIDIPEVTQLPTMFKKPLVSKPDSPFAKSRAKNQKTTQESIVNNENIDIPEVTQLPTMFKKPLVSKPDSPFAKSRAKIIELNVSEKLLTKELITKSISPFSKFKR